MVCKYFALRRKSRASKFKVYYVSGNDEWSYTGQEMLISDIKQNNFLYCQKVNY